VLYATEEGGRVVSVRPGATAPRVFARGFRESTLGLTWLHGRLYVSDKGRVSVLTDPDGNRVADGRRALVDHLPNRLHQQDAIVPGPDGRLYLGSGSTCNACRQADRRSAAILSLRPDGSDLRVVASGLRNPYGLAFDPQGRLWATDNGRDDERLDAPDELDRIVPGHRYGFPSCYGRRQGSGCAGTDSPVALLEPHSSADGLAFAPASFAPGMGGDAFVALWGTYFGTARGRYVARVELGRRPRVTRFATGLDHPLAVAFTPAGQLLVADWGTGVIWRIAHR
jgi:glucose/arabinose dehydrogenase